MTSSNILRGAFAALALPLLVCGQAMAQKPSQSTSDFLKEMDISNVRKPAQKKTGRAAVEAVFDRLVRIRFGDTHNMFFFAASGSVIVTRGAPKSDVLMGTWRAQAGTDKICFDFKGEVPATCDRFEVTGDQVMLIADNGRRFAGALVPEKKPATQTAGKPPTTAPGPAKPPEQGDPRFCKGLLAIADAAVGRPGLEALIDHKIGPINPSKGDPDAVEEVFQSTVKLGDCLVDPFSHVPRHNCMMPMRPKDPEAVKLYFYVNTQVRLCLGTKIIESKVSNVIKLGYYDKVPYASSTYTLKKGIELSVDLREHGRCLDMVYDLCDDKYGVYVRLQDRR